MVVVGGGGEWLVVGLVVVSVLCRNNGHRYHFHRHQLGCSKTHIEETCIYIIFQYWPEELVCVPNVFTI